MTDESVYLCISAHNSVGDRSIHSQGARGAFFSTKHQKQAQDSLLSFALEV